MQTDITSKRQVASSIQVTTALAGLSQVHGISSSSSNINHRKPAGVLHQTVVATLQFRSMAREHRAGTPTPATMHLATNAHMRRWPRAREFLVNVPATSLILQALITVLSIVGRLHRSVSQSPWMITVLDSLKLLSTNLPTSPLAVTAVHSKITQLTETVRPYRARVAPC